MIKRGVESSRISDIAETKRLTFKINPESKKRIIPQEWKKNINEILQRELLQANRNYASKKDLLIENVNKESEKEPGKFYEDLVDRWCWHNDYYENLLEPALPLIFEKNPLDLSLYQIESLKLAYTTSSLVDSATLASSAAIKKVLQKWIEKNKHLPAEELSLVLTPAKDSFWTEYHVDHLKYLSAKKRIDSSELELKGKLMRKYHIEDEEIFNGRLETFKAEKNLSPEELDKRISGMLMPEGKKIEHFYQTIERPRQQAISKIVEFDNVEEYDLLTNLVGISGFILRKKILDILNQTKILPNDGSIYGVEDQEIMKGLEKLLEYRRKYMDKKTKHVQQSTSETCATACAEMILKSVDRSNDDRDIENDLFNKCRSKNTTGTLFSALAGAISDEGLEVILEHSESAMFKYDSKIFDKQTYDKVLKEYASYVDPKKYEVLNGEDITVNKIRNLLENNYRVILAGFIGGNILHSVLVTGYSEEGLIVHDPLNKKEATWSKIRTENFINTPIGSWLIAARPKNDELQKLNDRSVPFQKEAKNLLGIKEGGEDL